MNIVETMELGQSKVDTGGKNPAGSAKTHYLQRTDQRKGEAKETGFRKPTQGTSQEAWIWVRVRDSKVAVVLLPEEL